MAPLSSGRLLESVACRLEAHGDDEREVRGCSVLEHPAARRRAAVDCAHVAAFGLTWCRDGDGATAARDERDAPARPCRRPGERVTRRSRETLVAVGPAERSRPGARGVPSVHREELAALRRRERAHRTGAHRLPRARRGPLGAASGGRAGPAPAQGQLRRRRRGDGAVRRDRPDRRAARRRPPSARHGPGRAAEGFDFSEQSIGTNGIGTVLVERQPVLVRGPEHYNALLENLTCAGTPIIEPYIGRMLGSFSLACVVARRPSADAGDGPRHRPTDRVAHPGGGRRPTPSTRPGRTSRWTGRTPGPLCRRRGHRARQPPRPAPHRPGTPRAPVAVPRRARRRAPARMHVPALGRSPRRRRRTGRRRKQGGLQRAAAQAALPRTTGRQRVQAGCRHLRFGPADRGSRTAALPRRRAIGNSRRWCGTVSWSRVFGAGGTGKLQTALRTLRRHGVDDPLIVEPHLDPGWFAAAGAAAADGRGLVLRRVHASPSPSVARSRRWSRQG